jgi:FkbM family methyltransferase
VGGLASKVGYAESAAGAAAAAIVTLISGTIIVALLAGACAALGVFAARMLRRMDRYTERMDRYIEQMETRLGARFIAAEARIAASETAIAGLANSVSTIAGNVSALQTATGTLQYRADSATSDIRQLGEETNALRVGLRESLRSGTFPRDLLDGRNFDPEVDLIEPIAKTLRTRTAIDVGANRGAFTEVLRRNRLSVEAFEPFPALADDLARRFRGDTSVRIYAMACSDRIGEAKLSLAAEGDRHVDSTLFSTLEPHPIFETLAFSREISVPLATLDSVLAPGGPIDVGLLKTDTEGHDLKVLKGAGNIRAEAILAECWDAAFPFNMGKVENTLAHYLAAVDRVRFPHHILMWRGKDPAEFGLIADAEAMPSESWGNVLFASRADIADAVLGKARALYGQDRVVVAGEAASRD